MSNDAHAGDNRMTSPARAALRAASMAAGMLAAAVFPDDDGVRDAPARGVGQRRKVLALALAARDQDDALLERLEGLDRRGDVGALRVVVERHARDVAYELDAVRHGSEAAHRAPNGLDSNAGPERARGG